MTRDGDMRLKINRPDRDSKAERPPTSAEAEAAGFNPEANRRSRERNARLEAAMYDAIDAGAPLDTAREWLFTLRRYPTILCPLVLAADHDAQPCWRCDMVKAGRAE